MLTGRHSALSVYPFGPNLRTDADGLAVGAPSRFVGELMDSMLDGCATIDDATLYRDLLDLHRTLGIEVEPSAAAGFAGPAHLLHSETGRAYLRENRLDDKMPHATHIAWTTGGSFVPAEQHEFFRQTAEQTHSQTSVS